MVKHISLCFSVCFFFTEWIFAQQVEIIGSLKVSEMDTISEGSTVVVRKVDGTFAERSNQLYVSAYGDTLYLGTSWVIVPGISEANCETSEIIVDSDGNEYQSVLIGSQTWLTSNLRTTSFRDGTPIPLVTDNSIWANLTSPAYSWYDNNIGYAEIYGALYNYFALADTLPYSKEICPCNWHVPSDNEWLTLINYLGGSSIAGGPLKESGIVHWDPPNTGATNSSGFTTVAGGNRNTNGFFDEFGTGGFFWSTSLYSAERAWYYWLSYDSVEAFRDHNLKDIGFSVRCIKN